MGWYKGAASIVFAIFAVTYGATISNDIFHIIFFVALFSVSVQGGLLPKVARKLDLIDDHELVLKTFNDYSENSSTNLVEFMIKEDSLMANKLIKEITIPEDILIVLIKRDKENIIPNGSTIVLPGDILVLTGNNLGGFNYCKDMGDINLMECIIGNSSEALYKPVKELDIAEGVLIIMVKRKDKVLIPNGDTKLQLGDIVVITSNDAKKLHKVKI